MRLFCMLGLHTAVQAPEEHCHCRRAPLQESPARLFSLAALNQLAAGDAGGALSVDEWRAHTRCSGWGGWRGPAGGGGGGGMEVDGAGAAEEPQVRCCSL